MAKLRFIETDGTVHDIDAQAGYSVMEAAIWNDVPGIEAACGGACACATCHVIVDDAWLARTGAASDQERGLLEAEGKWSANARLSCQIKVSAALDGLLLHLPENQ